MQGYTNRIQLKIILVTTIQYKDRLFFWSLVNSAVLPSFMKQIQNIFMFYMLRGSYNIDQSADKNSCTLSNISLEYPLHEGLELTKIKVLLKSRQNIIGT